MLAIIVSIVFIMLLIQHHAAGGQSCFAPLGWLLVRADVWYRLRLWCVSVTWQYPWLRGSTATESQSRRGGKWQTPCGSLEDEQMAVPQWSCQLCLVPAMANSAINDFILCPVFTLMAGVSLASLLKDYAQGFWSLASNFTVFSKVQRTLLLSLCLWT